MRTRNKDDVYANLLEHYFREDSWDDVSRREIELADKFVASYTVDVFKTLNELQLQLLFILFDKHTQNTDHLSYTLQKSRRGTARVASALVNRGLAYWDIPISSNADMGYDLTIANDAMVNKDKKAKTE